MNSSVNDTARPENRRDLNKRTALCGLAVVLILALALRLYGLDWDDGFAWTPHPDERAIMFKVADLSFPSISNLPLLLDADSSPLNPRWFPYGSFPIYVLKATGVFSGFIPGLDPDDLRVPGRTVSALADVATVALVYALGAMIWSRRIGLLASALVAVAVIHIQLSHFFAVDTVMALLCFTSVLFLVRVARSGRLSDSLLAGLFLGLGLATKISVAPILAAYVVAHFIPAFGLVDSDYSQNLPFADRTSNAIGNAVLGGLVIIAAFFVAQPYALLDWERFSADITEQSEMVRRIRDYPYTRQYIDTTPYLYHVQQLSVWGLGLPLGIVAWLGTLYAALRGLRLWWALGYLLVGVCMPAAILVASNSFAAIILSSAIAVGAILVTLPVRRPDTRITALLLSWVVPYFLITGAFDVKFMRYLIPITPFLLLFGAKMLADIWCAAGRLAGGIRLSARITLGLVGTLTFATTLFYAVSYIGIYAETHSAVRAGEWIRSNVPSDSLILREHWDEGVPDLYGYELDELPIYNPDNHEKFSAMSDQLASADYVLIYSNRLYGTVARLPERYPVSREYYKQLFSGGLGYSLEAHFDTHPNLFGVGFLDDTFGRPDLPVPVGVERSDPYAVSLNLGFADESFSVYDHPKLLIFRNQARLDSQTIYDRILESSGGFPTRQSGLRVPPSESGNSRQLMLSPDQLEARQMGGTWTDIINPNRRADWMSVAIWIVVAEVIALIVFPLAFAVFRPLADRGWLFSKGLGLLLLGLVVWLLSSLELMAFTRTAVIAGAVALSLVNLALLVMKWEEIRTFFKRRWKTVLVAELVFLAAFAAFILVRMANPDLWHPYRGGEKPMDMAYLNAVLKSSFMPPYDPWFGGGYINYYYWGQFLVGMLIHATGITPEIALNLAVPLFFAMTAAFSYSVVYNLASAAGSRRLVSGGFSPTLAGVLGALFVVLLGNLDGAIQLGQGAWRVAVEGLPMGEFDFWRSSRMMPPDPPGHEITEFPFFTFLFADPHAHLWALPFTVLCIGICTAVVLGIKSRAGWDSFWNTEQFLRIAVLGIAVGALRLLNTWDYPTYLLFGAAAITIGEYLAQGGLSSLMLLRSGVKSALVFLIGYVVLLPYHLYYETFFSSVERTTNTTPLWQFLAITGLFVFAIGSFYLWQLRGVLASTLSAIRPTYDSLLDTLSERRGNPAFQVGPWTLLALVVSALAAGYVLTALAYGYGAGGTIIFAIALIALIVAVAWRALANPGRDTPVTLFVSLMSGTAVALVLGLDVFRVEGDIERMNSVFKFYMQVWVLLALAAAFMVWRLFGSELFNGARPWGYRYVWAGGLAVLIMSAAVYPVLGTQDRLRDRFNGNVTPLTLNGLAYVEGTIYHESEGPIDLEADFEGIRWLRENVRGSPIILEANTPTYRWGGRVSIYTGLPSVVGWQWHQEQQRWDYRQMVAPRIRDVERIYSTQDVSVARDLLAQYGVKYIYVGQLERSYYSPEGIAKFDSSLSSYVSKVFHSDEVTIYEVLN
ncbi:MAG: hypothetical protein F4Y49_05055 [Dehalococcoidia bacterium]|nr:hypothetical protein [Dehalococcoidia bacterium]